MSSFLKKLATKELKKENLSYLSLLNKIFILLYFCHMNNFCVNICSSDFFGHQNSFLTALYFVFNVCRVAINYFYDQKLYIYEFIKEVVKHCNSIIKVLLLELKKIKLKLYESLHRPTWFKT